MRERLKTLVLDANGFMWKEIAADTVLLGLLGRKEYLELPARLRRVPILRELRWRYEALSYVGDWKDALLASAALDVRVCNITNLVEYAKCMRRIGEFDLIVVLHTAAGDSMGLLQRAASRLRHRRGKLAVFVGNEYDLMDEKLGFLRSAGADYVCSQLPIESARWLYAGSAARVLEMPHALNHDVYHPPAEDGRTVDLGFIGALYPPFIGDLERTRFMKTVQEAAPSRGLRCDIRESNVPRLEWAAFLRSCRGTIGAESGSYFLDRRGELVGGAKAFLAAHPGAGFDQIYERFFASPAAEYVSGKCVSSRHFEAIGTQTCQILLEGDYNGILRAGEHYISVAKDLANVEEALDQFGDAGHRAEVAKRAYEYVLEEHTYAWRVEALVEAVS